VAGLEIFLHDRLAHRLDVVPEALVRPIGRLQQNIAISVPALSEFDPVHGKRFIRFCYAGATADVTEAVERLAAWLKPG
jgi:hypothetical protein